MIGMPATSSTGGVPSPKVVSSVDPWNGRSMNSAVPPSARKWSRAL